MAVGLLSACMECKEMRRILMYTIYRHCAEKDFSSPTWQSSSIPTVRSDVFILGTTLLLHCTLFFIKRVLQVGT